MEKLIIAAQNGDHSAAETIIIENDKLIRHMMKKAGVSPLNEDYHSIGMFSTYKAIMNFDLEKDIKFSTFAAKIMYNDFLIEKRKISQSKHKALLTAISIETPIADGLTIGDTIVDYMTYQRMLEAESPRIMEAVSYLSELEKKVFMLRFIDGMLLPEIKETLGLKWSNSYMSRYVNNIKAKLAVILGIDYEQAKQIHIKRFEKEWRK